jgi:CubicO group peptidase (beta-lactamase class C family)
MVMNRSGKQSSSSITPARLRCATGLSAAWLLGMSAALLNASEKVSDIKELGKLRRQFQDQELITAKPFTRVFTPGEPPRIVWRDVEEVRRLGCVGKPQVRWFDANLKEAAVPDHPGRWAAWVEDRAPNGTLVRRSLAFYARPKDFLAYLSPSLPLEHLPGPISPEVWREHQDEINHCLGRMLFSLNDSEAGAILLAGLTEARPRGRRPSLVETAQALHEDFHFRLKMEVQGLWGNALGLKPPRALEKPAPTLHEDSMHEAGVASDAKAQLDAVLEAWEADTREPFVTLVARNGVIITHKAVGHDVAGKAIDLDYKAGVASITKTATAILFSQFLQQGLVRLDDPISRVFPDYPRDSEHVPTFRQCLTHMSGFSGHGDWGGARNPHLDNILLNGIDANQPGSAYTYSGMGFDVTALAMQILSGQSFTRLYKEHLLDPLGMRTATIEDGSAGAHFTALDLAKLAQWLVNRGSYGGREFISAHNFQQLLPEDLGLRYPGVTREIEGIGMHWMHDRKPGAPTNSTCPEDLILSSQTLGHGSLSSCILRADLENQLIVVQIRRQAGPRFGEWQTKFLQTVARTIQKVIPAVSTTRPQNPP